MRVVLVVLMMFAVAVLSGCLGSDEAPSGVGDEETEVVLLAWQNETLEGTTRVGACVGVLSGVCHNSDLPASETTWYEMSTPGPIRGVEIDSWTRGLVRGEAEVFFLGCTKETAEGCPDTTHWIRMELGAGGVSGGGESETSLATGEVAPWNATTLRIGHVREAHFEQLRVATPVEVTMRVALSYVPA